MMLLGAGSFLGVDVAVAAAALNMLGLVVLGYLAIALLRRRYEGKTLVAASACALLGIGSSQVAAMFLAGLFRRAEPSRSVASPGIWGERDDRSHPLDGMRQPTGRLDP
ncbi:hypothetical protein [Sorangium sp. So ce1078]|uniref:hypothetical protein n=1 Tax=Sorangium sp. So ce1078 TaxID=3133329 RepID=UPI003F63C7C3